MLRRELRAARRALSDDERAARSAACIDRLVALLTPFPATVIGGFSPLAGELELRPAFHRLLALGHTMALPRMQGETRPLVFHVYKEGDPLIIGGFRVAEPSAEAPVVRPRVVLVPLLGFDRHGHRLGYGKGYYDRTLLNLRTDDPELLALGIGFALQEVTRVPTHAGDQPVDAVFTEQETVTVTPALDPAGTGPPHR